MKPFIYSGPLACLVIIIIVIKWLHTKKLFQQQILQMKSHSSFWFSMQAFLIDESRASLAGNWSSVLMLSWFELEQTCFYYVKYTLNNSVFCVSVMVQSLVTPGLCFVFINILEFSVFCYFSSSV